MKLVNRTQNSELAGDLEIAETFMSRSIGLLGRANLPTGHALWIQGSRLVSCNSIHTMFMRFAIDAVFVDQKLIVRKVCHNLGPWRMTWPVVGANSVFELPAGTLNRGKTQIGDQLHVGD